MASTKRIKCKACNTWNDDIDFCKACHSPISFQKIIEIKETERRIKEKEKPKDKIDILLDNLKNHRFFLVRVFYSIIYSITMIISFIVGAFGFIVAFLNG